jgi:hypothetical protein
MTETWGEAEAILVVQDFDVHEVHEVLRNRQGGVEGRATQSGIGVATGVVS